MSLGSNDFRAGHARSMKISCSVYHCGFSSRRVQGRVTGKTDEYGKYADHNPGDGFTGSGMVVGSR